MSPAYMTATRSAMLATTPRSWVMRTTVRLYLTRRSLSSSRIWAWMVTSRAVVGSSQIRIWGLQATAMAMTTRWRIPPENSCGYCLKRRSGSVMPTSRRYSTAFSRAARPFRCWCSCTASAIWSPMVLRGFRLVMGSCMIMAISCPRTRSQSFSFFRPDRRMGLPSSAPK